MSILAVFIKTLFWSTIIFIIIDVLHNAFEKLKSKSKPKTKNNNRTINITVNINDDKSRKASDNKLLEDEKTVN